MTNIGTAIFGAILIGAGLLVCMLVPLAAFFIVGSGAIVVRELTRS